MFRHITLPLLGPTIRISVFLSIIGTIQLFDMVWVLTGGGPIHASETMAVTMFQYGFRRFEVGYASAISVVDVPASAWCSRCSTSASCCAATSRAR